MGKLEERASRYIAGLKAALRNLAVPEGNLNYQALIEAVRRYLEDAEYYLGKGDPATALVASSYAEGLLDSLKYLGVLEPSWSMPRQRRVLVAGTFDLLHPGHIYFLREASRLGELYVIIARDRNVRRSKGRSPIFPENCRLELVSAIRYVRKAVLGGEEDLLKRVVELRPDIVVLGPDQPYKPGELKRKLEQRGLRGVEVLKLPARIMGEECPTSSSSIIKAVLRRFCGCSEKT